MESLASPADVAAVWRPLSDAETSRVETLIGFASAALRLKLPGVDNYIARGAIDPQLVAVAVAAKVRDVLANPEGASQWSQSIGPASVSRSYGGDNRRRVGLFVFTDDDISALLPQPSRDIPRTIRTPVSEWGAF